MNKHRWLVSVFGVCVLLSLTATLAMAQGPNPQSGGKPIRSITAGAGLIGGGDSGDVTLAVANTYRLPQACANGQVSKWNGTAWTCANDGLTLPFVGTVNSSSTKAFELTQTGTTVAGLFQINNSASNAQALVAVTNGSGSAGMFNINNATNNKPALEVSTNGSGDALRIQNDGNGPAAEIYITNPANSKNAVEVSTAGTGWALDVGYFGTVGGAGSFFIRNPDSPSPAIGAQTNGTGPAIKAFNTGMGPAGNFSINNATNNRSALDVSTNGTGRAVNAYTTGTGNAANFSINNPVNTKFALDVNTNGNGDAIGAYTSGTGRAGWFNIDNPANSNDAVGAMTNGTGWAGQFYATGPSSKGVSISTRGGTGLEVIGGTKNAVVATNNGARLLYTEESSQVWFTDYGFGRLQNGRATVAIDPLFAQTINLDEPYHVFVQAYGDAELYVTNRTTSGFEIRARDGDPGVEFSYRLVAKRLGFEDKRLEHATWADSDPNLYSPK